MILNKSDFLLYYDSPLHLWAKAHNQYHPEVSLYHQLLAKQGYEVENYAKQFLLAKVTADYPADSQIEFQKTLQDENYETRSDALIYNSQTKAYDLYEIKSATNINKKYKLDITFQYLIASQILNLNKVYLVTLNKDYVKSGEIKLDQLFMIHDMSQHINKLKDQIYKNRQTALSIMQASQPPLDKHCYKPKTCPCLNLCYPNSPAHKICQLSWWKQGQYETLENKGFTDIREINEIENLNTKQQKEVKAHQTKKAIIDYQAIREFFACLDYPLYFLDYETFKPAIPIHDGYKPHQQITFQYSLHVVNSPEDEGIKHYEFLAVEPINPSKIIIEELLKVIGTQGAIIVWNKNFECKRNDELGELQPDYAQQMQYINDRVYDLMDIFRKGDYVDYRFEGSYSIKKILPVLAPNLSYADMDIGDGGLATTKWYEMVYGDLTNEQKNKIATNLLAYCKLDTWAMVEIWKKLAALLNCHQ